MRPRDPRVYQCGAALTISATKLAGITAAAGLIIALGRLRIGSDAGSTGSGDAGSAVDEFLPCAVSDAGGWNDKCRIQRVGQERHGQGGQGARRDAARVRVEDRQRLRAEHADRHLRGLHARGVAVGFKLAAATIESANANPDLSFAIIDDYADADFDGKPDAPNIKPLVFNTAEAAYLGGYAAAACRPRPASTRSAPSAACRSPRWRSSWTATSSARRSTTRTRARTSRSPGGTAPPRRGLFTGGFGRTTPRSRPLRTSSTRASTSSCPSAAPSTSAAATIRDSGKDAVMLGVDTDLAVADPSVADITLVSIMKAIDVSVYDTIAASKGDFDPTPYVGRAEERGRQALELPRLRVEASRRSHRRAEEAAGRHHRRHHQGRVEELDKPVRDLTLSALGASSRVLLAPVASVTPAREPTQVGF